MSCESHKKLIYLWDEISTEEKTMVQNHLDACPHCAMLFIEVQSMKEKFVQVTVFRATAPNAAQLTSRIMQAVHTQQKAKRIGLISHFLPGYQITRNAFAALSLFLLLSFSLEYSNTPTAHKQQPQGHRESVILNSSIIHAENRNKRQSVFKTCRTPFASQLAYLECIKDQLQ